MGDIKFKGESWTWSNNREGEGFIQEKLDRFLGSAEWLLHFDKVEVKHFLRQTSDHSLILLDFNLTRNKTQSRFIFDIRWTRKQETGGMIKEI